jgi:hypothetical protein
MSVSCGSVIGRFHCVTFLCMCLRYMLIFKARCYLLHVCVDNIKINTREIRYEVMIRNELCYVGSGGGYCAHRSVGLCFVMQDLSWPDK